ncbi:transposase zinc-binding domain-containing protein [Haloarcula marina]|uniref:transposase zinc-binding domain-containing protein n=1 Tax=Haloarcula marina TaxID=2961574 RepID=UPI0020B89860|nr:transposase zinc-binding domain-containing protein [Halomicroarcula marina]
MSTLEWGGLVQDWTHLDDEDESNEVAEIVQQPGRWQEEIEYSVYAESSMTLPGQGEKGPNCGVWKPAEFCDNCAEIAYAPNRCGRRSCPDCRGEWTKERAVGITKRISAARHTEQPGIDRRTIHAVMSPPEGKIRTLQQVYDGYRDAYRLAEKKGVRGGVAVFHGFRVKNDVQEQYQAADPDMGIWRWLLDVRPESWRDLTYWSPHYHIIGLCREFEADDPDAQDGWVARRVRSFTPYEGLRDREAYNDLVGGVRYLMSHATFETDTTRDCVRWFGELATTNFQPEEALSDGAYGVIDRVVREVVGADAKSSENEEESDECECCGSRSWSPIWDAGGALSDPRWCDQIGREKERRLVAAFEWAIGERVPPPGLRKARTEEEARDALKELL